MARRQDDMIRNTVTSDVSVSLMESDRIGAGEGGRPREVLHVNEMQRTPSREKELLRSGQLEGFSYRKHVAQRTRHRPSMSTAISH